MPGRTAVLERPKPPPLVEVGGERRRRRRHGRRKTQEERRRSGEGLDTPLLPPYSLYHYYKKTAAGVILASVWMENTSQSTVPAMDSVIFASAHRPPRRPSAAVRQCRRRTKLVPGEYWAIRPNSFPTWAPPTFEFRHHAQHLFVADYTNSSLFCAIYVYLPWQPLHISGEDFEQKMFGETVLRDNH
jgi:hypothetical protein